MLLIKYVMEEIKNRDFENKLYPNSFTLMSETYSVKNNLRFFFFCVYYLRVVETDNELFLTKDDILNIYIKAKRYISNLSKFINIYKFKKYKKYEYESDLNFIPLSKYKESEKINIIQNKTIYSFKLKDLINLWKISLHNNDNMFPLPKSLKNPFTNIKFDSYQLYNIYFKYGFSINIMPEIIIDFFKSNFNFNLFKMIGHEKLQINAINKFINKGSVVCLFDYIVMMLHDFRKDIDYYFLRTTLPVFKKLEVVKIMEKYIKYYLYFKYNNNPLRKEYFSNIIKKYLKKEIIPIQNKYFIQLTTSEINAYEYSRNSENNIENEIVLSDNSDSDMDIDNEEQLIESTTTSATNSIFRTNTNTYQNNALYRRGSYPRIFPPIVSNTYENYNENTNPFVPRNEIPRTPSHLDNTIVEAENNTNEILSRFNLGIR